MTPATEDKQVSAIRYHSVPPDCPEDRSGYNARIDMGRETCVSFNSVCF
jgi:hypothetical protein